jgi:hypothetical protein
MDICSECGTGYCLNRVRKVYGKRLSFGFCSPTCAKADLTREEKASQIVDALYQDGFVSDETMGSDDKFVGAVKVVAGLLKV